MAFRHGASLLFLASVLLALFFEDLWARAGGGGGYSGGSSGGSSYSGGGGDGDALAFYYLFRFLVHMTIHYPWIGIPLDIAALYAFYVYLNRGRGEMVSLAVRRGAKVAAIRVRREEVQGLQARDPHFEEGAFLKRMRGAFHKVQDAWVAQDLSKARPFLSDGVFSRFELQVGLQKEKNIQEVMENLSIQGAEIAQVRSTPLYDAIDVRFAASCVNYKIDAKTRKWTEGDRVATPFVEYWTFLRRCGAQTRNAPGPIEGSCPSCGAPIQAYDSARCESCSTFVNSAEHDWVLTEITQDCEWHRSRPEERIPGLPAMRGFDPGFSVFGLEDRASTMFWRWRKSFLERSHKPLLGLASEDFLPQVQKQATDYSPQRVYRIDAAVGSVDTLQIRRDGDWDEAAVLVKWSAKAYHWKAEQKEYTPLGPMLTHSIFLLRRKAGVSSVPGRAFSALLCAGCGAPFSDSGSGTCQYCQSPRNDGTRDWILAGVVLEQNWRNRIEERGAFQDPMAKENEEGLLGLGVDSESLMAALVAALNSDGKVSPKEMKMLAHYARLKHFPTDRMMALVSAARSGRLEVPAPTNTDEAKDLVRALAHMSLADGKVSEKEIQLMERLGKGAGLAPYDVTHIVRKERQRIFEKARSVLAGS